MKILNFLTAVLLILTSCSDSTGPGKTDKNDGTAIVKESIDSAGGSVESDNISLIIPPETFDQKTTVSISKTGDVYLSDYLVSETYSISGIPENFRNPISIRLKYNGSLKDKSYIVAGVKTTNPTNGEDEEIFSYLPVSESDGYLISSIPSSQSALKYAKQSDAAIDSHTFIINAITGFDEPEEQSHFHIVLPAEYLLFSNALNESLEEAYDFFQDSGFNYSKNKSVYGELDSIFVGLSDNESVFPLTSMAFPKEIIKGNFIIAVRKKNIDYIFDSEMRLNAISAMFNLIQYYYAGFNQHNHWFNYAVSDWLKRKFSINPSYIPSEFTNNKLMTLEGLRPFFSTVSIQNMITMGQANSPFVEYLDKHYNILAGDNVLKNIYDKIYEQESAVDAITQSVHTDINSLWTDYLKEFVSGNLYDIPAETFIAESNLSGSFNASPTDTVTTFTYQYGPLESKIYRINLNGIPDSSFKSVTCSLESSVAGETSCSVILFGLKNGKLNFIEKGSSITLDSLDSYTGNRILYALAVNTHVMKNEELSQDTIDFTVSVDQKEQSSQFAFTQASFKIKIYGHFLRQRTNFADTEYDDNFDPVIFPVIVKGVTSGTVFVGSAEELQDSHSTNYNLAVTFDDTFKTVTSFSLTGTVIQTGASPYTIDVMVSGGGMPFSNTYLGWNIFRLNGNDVPGAVIEYTYISETSTNQGASVTKLELLDFSGNDSSLIYIEFKE